MSDPNVDVELTRDELEQLCTAANAGDQEARVRLRQWLDAHPDAWRSVGDVGMRSELSVREALAGGDFLLSESLARSADALRDSLLPADPTPLEQLAVQRLVVTWFQVQLAEQHVASHRNAPGQCSYWTRSLDSAHKRFTGAVSHLQSLQKLLGRPVCKAAVAEALSSASSSAGNRDDAGSSSTQNPAEQPVAGTVRRAKNQLDHGERDRAGMQDDDPTGLSGVLPFRVGQSPSYGHQPGSHQLDAI